MLSKLEAGMRGLVELLPPPAFVCRIAGETRMAMTMISSILAIQTQELQSAASSVPLMASLLSKAKLVRGRDEVYVAAMPLRATEGAAQLAMSAAYSLNFWDFQHFMVILKPSSLLPPSQVLVFDFQPNDPEDIYVALAVLSGKAVPANMLDNTSIALQTRSYIQDQRSEYIVTGKNPSGTVLVRKMKTLPRRKCWFVGYSKADGVGIANEFNKTWDTYLRVGLHDCRDYTNGLVKQLTGENDVLRRLRSTGS